jgi:hypothetical protein
MLRKNAGRNNFWNIFLYFCRDACNCLIERSEIAMQTNISAVMSGLTDYIDIFDGILRHGHETYERYQPEFVVDHDASTQAHCTFRHILSKALGELSDLPDVKHFDIRGQNLWLIEAANAIIRFKKTNENGLSSNYPTSQAVAFDEGETLPGLPTEPTRLTIGYLLDATGTQFVRSQVSLPLKGVGWCAAIIPSSLRNEDEMAWYEVTKQTRFAAI